MSALADAAFGSRPGLHPLPAADGPQQQWWRAVALGGQGRYAAARSVLDRLDAPGSDPARRSLALSARGSHLRQLGGHGRARALDARALVLAAGPDAAPRSDALVGLAADALGSGRVGLAGRLLDEAGPGQGRCAVRWCWVAAETALCADTPGAAVVHAREAVARAADTGSVRHVVKSALVLAAAVGPDGGVERAAEVAQQARAHGLLPLEWAATMLLGAVSADPVERAAAGPRAAALRAVLDLRAGAQ